MERSDGLVCGMRFFFIPAKLAQLGGFAWFLRVKASCGLWDVGGFGRGGGCGCAIENFEFCYVNKGRRREKTREEESNN